MKNYKGIDSQIINQRLFEKYCQSQNYYYSRDINEILSDATIKGVIRYKDWNGYDQEDEYLKLCYKLGDQQNWLDSLKDIPIGDWTDDYFQSFYYICVTMFTIGYGDIASKNGLEKSKISK